MKFSATPVSLLVCGCLFLAGCFPPSQGQTPEEKESHYQTGKNRVAALDYPNAIKSFEKALEVNPRSAAAHFELASVYVITQQDPAAAIYHFQKYLSLSPGAHESEIVKQHILGCKQALAKEAGMLFTDREEQRSLARLMEQKRHVDEENKRLVQEVAQLRLFITTNRPAATGGSSSRVTPEPQSASVTPQRSPGSTSSSSVSAGRTRTYVVRDRETLSAIARKQGISVSSLQAANPGIDPRRLRAGQTINLP